MISGTVLLEIPGSRAIQRYDRPSATARMTDSLFSVTVYGFSDIAQRHRKISDIAQRH